MAEPLYPPPDPVTDASLAPVPPSLSPDAALDAVPPPSPPIYLLREDLKVPWDFVDMVIFIFFSLGILELSSDVAAWFAISYAGVKPDKIMEFAATNAAFIVWRQVLWFGLLLTYLFV